MLVDFDPDHYNTVYSIVSMMICDLLDDNRTDFGNIEPFTHNFHFSLICHEVSAGILRLILLPVLTRV